MPPSADRRFPAATSLAAQNWWIVRFSVERNGTNLHASCAVQSTLPGAAVALARDEAQRQSLAIIKHQIVHLDDCVIATDRALAERAIQNGQTALIGTLGLGQARDPSLLAMRAPQPQITRLNGILPWSSLLAQDDQRALPPALDRLMFDDALRADGLSDQCFAVLDGAKIFGLAERLAGSGLRHACLFKGAAAADWGDVAPWLVELTRDDRFARSLFTQSEKQRQEQAANPWGGGAAILIRSPLSFEGMRAHLRTLTMIIDRESGKRLYFRFYDPLTVRSVMTEMKPEKLQELLKGMACLFAPDPSGTGTLLRNMRA